MSIALFDHYLETQGYVHSLQQDYPEIATALNEYCLKINSVMHEVHDHFGEEKQVNQRLALWLVAFRYQRNSLLMLMGRQLDEGIALLRMSCEIIKTLKTLVAVPDAFDLWFTHDPEFQKLTKRHGRFETDDFLENQILDCYNFSSDFGVHSARTNLIWAHENPDRYVPMEEGVATILKRWMLGAGAINSVCLKLVLAEHPDEAETIGLGTMVGEMKLLERIQNDPFFK